MRIGRNAAVATMAAALTVGLGAGSALAQAPSPGGSQPGAGQQGTGKRGGKRHGPPLVKIAATYVGLSADAIREQLKAGKSLAQVAVAAGKTAAGLKAAVLADTKKHLDEAVAAGKLTAAQAQERLTALGSKLDELLNRTGPPAGGQGGKPGQGGKKGSPAIRGAVNATAKYTGLTVEQVREQVKAGKTLGQIATGAGKTVAGLKTAILADAKTAIDKLVAEGKISAAKGAAYLAEIQAHIDDIVNKAAPSK